MKGGKSKADTKGDGSDFNELEPLPYTSLIDGPLDSSPILNRNRFRESLLTLVQDNHFVDMICIALQGVHQIEPEPASSVAEVGGCVKPSPSSSTAVYDVTTVKECGISVTNTWVLPMIDGDSVRESLNALLQDNTFFDLISGALQPVNHVEHKPVSSVADVGGCVKPSPSSSTAADDGCGTSVTNTCVLPMIDRDSVRESLMALLQDNQFFYLVCGVLQQVHHVEHEPASSVADVGGCVKPSPSSSTAADDGGGTSVTNTCVLPMINRNSVRESLVALLQDNQLFELICGALQPVDHVEHELASSVADVGGCVKPSPSSSTAADGVTTLKVLPTEIWICIARKADGASLAKLTATSSYFQNVIVDGIAWREAFLRDLGLLPGQFGEIEVSRNWHIIYGFAFDRTHALPPNFSGSWTRVGAMVIDSSSAILNFNLTKSSPYLVDSVKNGIWIVDYVEASISGGADKVFMLEARHFEETVREGLEGMWENIQPFRAIRQQNDTHLSICDALHVDEEGTRGLFEEGSGGVGLQCIVTFHGAGTRSRPPQHQRCFIHCQVLRSPLNVAVRLRFMQRFSGC